jgi:hypothetical protein
MVLGPVADRLQSYRVSTCTLHLRELRLFDMPPPQWLNLASYRVVLDILWVYHKSLAAWAPLYLMIN